MCQILGHHFARHRLAHDAKHVPTTMRSRIGRNLKEDNGNSCRRTGGRPSKSSSSVGDKQESTACRNSEDTCHPAPNHRRFLCQFQTSHTLILLPPPPPQDVSVQALPPAACPPSFGKGAPCKAMASASLAPLGVRESDGSARGLNASSCPALCPPLREQDVSEEDGGGADDVQRSTGPAGSLRGRREEGNAVRSWGFAPLFRGDQTS